MIDEAAEPTKASLIREALQQKNYNHLRQMLKTTEVADIAEACAEIDVVENMALLRLVPKLRRAQVFSHLPLERQELLLAELPDVAITSLLNEMEPDDRTKLLEELNPEIATKVIQKLTPNERRVAWQLLSYPENSVGRLMTPEFVAVPIGMNVSDAIEYIRWNASRYSEDLLNKIFVVDPQSIYVGDVSLAGMLIADPTSQPVENIINKTQVYLSANDDQEKAVDYFRKYGRTIIPVIDEKNTLLGVVTADDVFDVAEEEATEDIQQFGGTATLEDSYFETPLWMMLRKRAGWLSVLFLGELFTGTAMRHYDDAIASMRYLVYFVPLIISSGGNSGSQAASLIIRGLAVREMMLRDWRRIFGREIMMGLGLGSILGLLGLLRALTWGQGPQVGIIVALSLVCVVIFGAVVGAMLPFLFKRLNLDPAVSSSPFIASLVDLFGIVIFFEIAVFVTRNYIFG